MPTVIVDGKYCHSRSFCGEESADGKDFGDACFWIGENDIRLDLQVFEMETKDFDIARTAMENINVSGRNLPPAMRFSMKTPKGIQLSRAIMIIKSSI